MSDDKIIEALELFIGALESAVAVLRQNLPKKENKNHKRSSWIPDKITWVEAEGSKGPYERADPQGTDDFKIMLTDLKAHNDKLTRDGWFYWVFRDQATVGRKEKRERTVSPTDPHVRMDKTLENIRKAGEKLTKEQAC